MSGNRGAKWTCAEECGPAASTFLPSSGRVPYEPAPFPSSRVSRTNVPESKRTVLRNQSISISAGVEGAVLLKPTFTSYSTGEMVAIGRHIAAKDTVRISNDVRPLLPFMTVRHGALAAERSAAWRAANAPQKVLDRIGTLKRPPVSPASVAQLVSWSWRGRATRQAREGG
jgi:hypothetical protein